MGERPSGGGVDPGGNEVSMDRHVYNAGVDQCAVVGPRASRDGSDAMGEAAQSRSEVGLLHHRFKDDIGGGDY